MRRCRECDHRASDHVLEFDGQFVTVRCDGWPCQCERFVRIDDMLADRMRPLPGGRLDHRLLRREVR